MTVTSTSPESVVGEFFAAFGAGDLTAARALLRDDLAFKGPLDTFDTADAYITAIAGLAPLVQGIQQHKLFVQGDDVAVLYDMLTPMGTSPIAEWHHVCDGKIVAIQVYFDARPFAVARAAHSAPAGTSPAEVVRRFHQEVWNAGKPEAVDQFVGPDYRIHMPLPDQGSAGLKQFVRTVHLGFPDWHETIEDLVVEGDKVVVRGVIRGTQTGPYMDMPPTGKSIEMSMIHIFRVAHGRIVEDWGEGDTLGMLHQLGVTPGMSEPASAPARRGAAPPSWQEEANKALARRFVDRVFNAGDMDAYDTLVADDYLNHNPPIPGVPGTKAGFEQSVILTRQAFPDVHVGIEDLLAEDDRVMFRDRARATHTGDFQGVAPTGRSLVWTEMHFFRVRDGRIAEHWANFDQLGILTQMGVLPTPNH